MNFKQIVSTAVMTALVLSLAGCAEPEQDTVTIAVIGNEADLYPGYRTGPKRPRRTHARNMRKAVSVSNMNFTAMTAAMRKAPR